MKAALAPLLDLRRGQVTDAARLKELDYKAGEPRRRWLARHGVAAGNVDPTCVPFYLLVVGCPGKIPFGFCRELSVEYAVGLLSFDTPAEYAAYAASVVAAESNELRPRSRQVTFFAPRHPYDRATQLSADKLVKPLSEGRSPAASAAGSSRSRATPRRTGRSPACSRDARRPDSCSRRATGWGSRPATPTSARSRVRSSARTGPAGRVRSSGASTSPEPTFPTTPTWRASSRSSSPASAAERPTRDRFSHKPGEEPPKLAEAAFAAALPRRLLAHPGGSALGCIGHVERAWGDSIVEAGAGPQLIPFENAIGNILAGKPIGLALKDFNERFAALSVSLAGMLEQIGDGLIVPDRQLAKAWIQRNDAEGYALFGDPAARLRLDQAA